MFKKTSFYKCLISCALLLNSSFLYANNNFSNPDNLISQNPSNYINNFNELSLIYENKGKGNFIIKGYGKENKKEDFIKYQNLVEAFFSNNNKSLSLTYLFRIIDINFYIDDSYNNASYSNIEDKEIRSCYINILVNSDENNLILSDDSKNFNLMLTHELSHCLLGKNIFNDKQFWKYNLDNKKENFLNKIIVKNTTSNVKIINGKPFYSGPIPIVVYHEIFADVFSSLLLYSNGMLDIEDIKKLKDKRTEDYNSLGTNPRSSYISFKALDNLIDILNKNENLSLSIEEIRELSELLSQKYFIEYLLQDI